MLLVRSGVSTVQVEFVAAIAMDALRVQLSHCTECPCKLMRETRVRDALLKKIAHTLRRCNSQNWGRLMLLRRETRRNGMLARPEIVPGRR